jgi:hypothetical protein
VVYFSVFFIMEIIYRWRIRFDCEFIEPQDIMTLDEFKERVELGEKLVLLDDLVLDVKRYSYYHPGGFFALE